METEITPEDMAGTMSWINRIMKAKISHAIIM